MEIELTTRPLIANLTIKSENTKIVEDLAIVSNGRGYIPDVCIENLISIAREMNIYNGKTDIDFVQMVYEAFLSDSERETFLSIIR